MRRARRIYFVLLLLMATTACLADALPDIGLLPDNSAQQVNGAFKPGSHVKLFIPNLPYLAISHAINAALLRPANNRQGWQYDLAISHHSIDNKVWEFTLRDDVYFQDGTHFNADSVIENMRAFQQAPFTFTKLHTILERVEKLDDYQVKFYLSEPYGVFLYDAIWLQFYTTDYLKKFGWNGKPTCPNLAEPGPYALGPYRLIEGYIEGDRSSAKIVLKANQDYWGVPKPKVEYITIFTDINAQQATEFVQHHEGKIDLTSIAFEDQVDTVLSPYAKLAVSPSKNNYAMHINMLNGNPALRQQGIRSVINQAIDQNYLLNLSMLGEGVLSPTTVSPHFYKVDEAIQLADSYFSVFKAQAATSLETLRQAIAKYQQEQGHSPESKLKLTAVTQESFLFLLKDIQYFLAQVGIELDIELLPSEKEVFQELFATWKNRNKQTWDLLLWGNYDWYKHPWAAFFVYRPLTDWSTIPMNDKLVALTDQLLSMGVQHQGYVPLLAELIQYVHEQNFMVFLPTPNNVYAVNKEVVFTPGSSAYIYLRELEVTDLHWSLRKKDTPYPEERLKPLVINRQSFSRVGHDE